MTDREKLIELLDNSFEKQYEKRGLLTAHHTATDLIANGVTFATDTNDGGKWISVKDRLPEKGGSYLVFSSKSKTVFTAHYWLGDRWSNRANGQFITHWMPLPEAPKGE